MNPEALLSHAEFLRSLARSLLSEDDRVEDVVQQTWMTAIQCPPRNPDSLRSWLGTVTVNFAKKSIREESRRAQREQAVSPTRAELSAYDVVQRESSVRRLVDSVFSLPEPYRSTILQRYYDDATPTQISRREGIPVETVRTRLKRGLGLLRRDLEGSKEKGQGSTSWRQALIPLAGVPVKGASVLSTSPKAVGGVSIFKGIASAVPLQNPLIAAALLLTTSFAFLWIFLRPTPPIDEARVAAPVENPMPLDPLGDGSEPYVVAPLETDSSETDAPTVVETGTLIVRVQDSDGTPVDGGLVEVMPYSKQNRVPSPLLEAEEQRTDTKGTTSFLELSPNRYRVRVSRGTSRWIRVEAGETLEIETKLGPGFEVAGTVVDLDARPVPDATIWITESTAPGGAAVVNTDAEGKFTIRSFPRSGALAARRAGHTASRLIPVAGLRPSERVALELTLGGPGGTILGQVVDSAGNPLPRSGVVVAKRAFEAAKMDRKGHRYQDFQLFRVRADSDGRFEIRDVPAGEWWIEVGALGFGSWRSSLSVETESSTSVAPVLHPGAFVEGKVSGSDGSPRAHIRIDAFPEDRFYSELNAFHAGFTNDRGEFSIGPIASGLHELRAYSRSLGQAANTIHIASGQTIQWNPILDPGRALCGSLRDEHGQPLAEWSIELTRLKKGYKKTVGRAKTDRKGRFSIANCTETTYRLEVLDPDQPRGAPALVLDEVSPGPEDKTLVIPAASLRSARITGSIRLPEATADRPSVLVLESTDGFYSSELIHDPSRFLAGPFRPAEYFLSLKNPQYGRLDLGRLKLSRGQTLDLGEIEFEAPGEISLHLKREDGDPIDYRYLSIVDHHLTRICSLRTHDDFAFAEDPLAPGEYFLQPRLGGVDQSLIPFRIRSRETTRLEPRLEPGHLCRVEIELPDPESRPARLFSRVRRGADLAAGKNFRYQGVIPGNHTYYLRPGLYTVEIETDTGLHGRATFEVPEDRRGFDPVRVLMR